MTKMGYIYILASKPYGTLYVGVTSNLLRRVHEHRNGAVPGFTKKYGIKRLVYFEAHDAIDTAIAREKAVKNWRRDWKIALIEEANPNWADLSDTLA